MMQYEASADAAHRILIVEDSPTQREELRFLLEEEGYSVVTASNGVEGLAAAKANANTVALVISDIVMPEMDGYELSKALRAEPETRHLPVILLTSLADPQDVVRGLEAGASNFICKPYDGPALVARIRNVLVNEELRKSSSSEMGINIFFAGKRFFITADRLQILDLLLSTYENAVSQNSELSRARDALLSLNNTLEAKVAERTATLTLEMEERKRAEDELKRRNAELERFNRAAAGREIRMVELKQQVNQLARRLGEPPPYTLAFLSQDGPADASFDLSAENEPDHQASGEIKP